MEITNYLDDGADAQAKAILAIINAKLGISNHPYDRDAIGGGISVDRFHNCREQGYSIVARPDWSGNCRIVVFSENRNSDSIVVMSWESSLGPLNPVTTHDISEEMWKSRKMIDPYELNQAAEYVLEEIRGYYPKWETA